MSGDTETERKRPTMSEFQIVYTYLSALVGRFRDDERGSATAQDLVMLGVALVAAAVVAGVLWAKLKGGAEHVDVPTPAAP
jgi:hypothetical protein